MTAAKPLSRIKEISLDRLEPDSIGLTVKNSDGSEYRGAIASVDIGNLVASLITSVGRTLDTGEIAASKSDLASTKVFIPGAGIGFGNTVAGPVLVAQAGGLALVFSITHSNLVNMAKQILEDLENIEEIDRPPRHH
jgi:hypothetical protein